MLKFIGKRLLATIPTLLIVSVVAFLIVYLIPGGPATAMLGMEASPDEINALNDSLGFNRSFFEQYFSWIGGVFQGNWGESYFLKMSVLDALGQYFWPTLSIAIFAEIIALIISLPLGLLAAYKRGTAIDIATSTIALVGVAVPSFLLSILLMVLLAVNTHLFPVAGYADISKGIFEHLRYIFIPSLSLGIVQAAYLVRVIRNSMLDVMKNPYIKTARAKGLGDFKILVKYGLKNALPVILTAIGQSFGTLITGTIVTETIFNIPGLGLLTMNSIAKRDVFVIQGVVLFVTLIYILVNLIVDILYTTADPRIQLSGRGGKE